MVLEEGQICFVGDSCLIMIKVVIKGMVAEEVAEETETHTPPHVHLPLPHPVNLLPVLPLPTLP